MKKLNLSIPAMHCNHCVHTINMELSELEGVEAVNINLDQKSVDIDFDDPATETQIRDLLQEINYPAVN